jgi:hypothetical protein
MLEVELLVLTYAAFLHLLQWANWVHKISGRVKG